MNCKCQAFFVPYKRYTEASKILETYVVYNKFIYCFFLEFLNTLDTFYHFEIIWHEPIYPHPYVLHNNSLIDTHGEKTRCQKLSFFGIHF